MPNPQASAAFTAAMDRVRDEMAVATNPAVEAVGEIMTLYLQAHPVAAEALLAEDKILAGAYLAMEQYARKNRGGASTVCVPPARADALILDYYGLGADANPAPILAASPVPADDFAKRHVVIDTDCFRPQGKAVENPQGGIDAVGLVRVHIHGTAHISRNLKTHGVPSLISKILGVLPNELSDGHVDLPGVGVDAVPQHVVRQGLGLEQVPGGAFVRVHLRVNVAQQVRGQVELTYAI